MIFIMFDTETSGLTLPSVAPLDAQPHIIELGAVKCDEQKELARLSQLIHPPCKLDKKITEITGLKTADLKNAPTFAEFAPALAEFFAGADFLICHNAAFDLQVLKIELERAGVADFPIPNQVVCSANEYVHVLGYRPKMTDLYEHILHVPLAQTHRALDDAAALHELLRADGFLGLQKIKTKPAFSLEPS